MTEGAHANAALDETWNMVLVRWAYLRIQRGLPLTERVLFELRRIFADDLVGARRAGG